MQQNTQDFLADLRGFFPGLIFFCIKIAVINCFNKKFIHLGKPKSPNHKPNWSQKDYEDVSNKHNVPFQQ